MFNTVPLIYFWESNRNVKKYYTAFVENLCERKMCPRLYQNQNFVEFLDYIYTLFQILEIIIDFIVCYRRLCKR